MLPWVAGAGLSAEVVAAGQSDGVVWVDTHPFPQPRPLTPLDSLLPARPSL